MIERAGGIFAEVFPEKIYKWVIVKLWKKKKNAHLSFWAITARILSAEYALKRGHSCAAFFLYPDLLPLICISHLILKVYPSSPLSFFLHRGLLLSVWRLKWEISARIYRGHVERSWQQLQPRTPSLLSVYAPIHTHMQTNSTQQSCVPCLPLL